MVQGSVGSLTAPWQLLVSLASVSGLGVEGFKVSKALKHDYMLCCEVPQIDLYGR